jgi:hypothetical protein
MIMASKQEMLEFLEGLHEELSELLGYSTEGSDEDEAED